MILTIDHFRSGSNSCKILCSEENGYKLERVKGVDLFPGTVHCETAVLLVKERD